MDNATYDEIREQIEEWEVTLAPKAYLREVLALADTLPVGAEGRAELLYVAGESLLAQQRAAEAILYFEQTAHDGGLTTLAPVVGKLVALLRLGEDAATTALLTELRRGTARAGDAVGLHLEVAEALEMEGRVQEALRWLSMGLRDFDPATDEPDFDEESLLRSRYRVRRYADLAHDGFDRWYEDVKPDIASAIRERVAQGLGH